MESLKIIMISVGALIMIINIYRFVLFIRDSGDVMTMGKRSDRIWEGIALSLLVFFLAGYIMIAIIGKADVVMSGVLLGGSIFVAIVLTLLFNLVETVKERSIAIAETLIDVIDTRDPNLNGHSRYVRNVTMLFYDYLPQEVRNDINPVSLEYAALLHDVGKLGIPESILNKSDRLTEAEWLIMKMHPEIAMGILKSLPTFDHIKNWILYHHERYDGKGYYKVPGDQLPEAAKIIAVADTYCAITMRRSYKEPRTHEDAMETICDVAGTQLEPKLVDIFCRIPKERLVACVPEKVDIRWDAGVTSRTE